jgi:glycosyltransferase involved in cell wall biosynthesis
MASLGLSIIVPARDAGRHLRPAVQSALSAAGADAEVIVADDDSTDGSLASLGDLPVRVVAVKGRGEAAARNSGVAAARGRMITFLDADDLLTSAGLAPRLERLAAEPVLLAVGGLPTDLISEDGAVLGEVFERMAARLSFPFELTADFYRRGGFFPVSCSLYVYRREVFDLLGGYDATLAAAPDADFHFRLLARAAVPVLRVPVFSRRLHGANMSMAAHSGARSFRPEVLSAIETVNRRHGLTPSEIVPWESDYL